jgi:hypothetical protein
MKQVIDEIHQIRSDQPQAMAQALREVLADPATAQIVVDNMAIAAQQRATTAAGQGVWWLMRTVVIKLLVIGAIVVMAAKVVGWDMAAKLGKWLSTATS